MTPFHRQRPSEHIIGCKYRSSMLALTNTLPI